MNKEQTYLGDGVYASFDGYHIVLETSAQIPVHRIALEPEVYDALINYVDKLKNGTQITDE